MDFANPFSIMTLCQLLAVEAASLVWSMDREAAPFFDFIHCILFFTDKNQLHFDFPPAQIPPASITKRLIMTSNQKIILITYLLFYSIFSGYLKLDFEENRPPLTGKGDFMIK